MLNINNYPIKTENLQQSNNVMNDQDHLRKMFIGGLSAITTEESLRIFFSQWGDVIDAVVMRDPATKRSRGFGFITYSDQVMVDKAQSSRPHIIDGKTVDTKRALPRPELTKGETNTSVKKIFVGGLKENHDTQTLQDHFSQFGNVVSVKILTDKATGRKRGFAFVEFDDYDAVDKAVLHKVHIIKYVSVDVKKSVYKQELAKKMAAQQTGVLPTVGGISGAIAAGYQPTAAYNPQAAYAAYPTQMPAQVAYNGWGSYAQPGAPGSFQQGPPMSAAPGAYAYASAQNGGATTAWNGAYTTWAPNGYATQAAQAATAQSPAVAAAGNGWNPNAAAQNFGDYQQAYNGGPQKAGSLQTNRVNPYNVAAAPSYGI